LSFTTTSVPLDYGETCTSQSMQWDFFPSTRPEETKAGPRICSLYMPSGRSAIEAAMCLSSAHESCRSPRISSAPAISSLCSRNHWPLQQTPTQ